MLLQPYRGAWTVALLLLCLVTLPDIAHSCLIVREESAGVGRCVHSFAQKTLRQPLKLFDAAVTQEGPPAAYVLRALHIYVYHQRFLVGIAGAGQYLALRATCETATPEVYAMCLAAGVGLVAHTVYGHHW